MRKYRDEKRFQNIEMNPESQDNKLLESESNDTLVAINVGVYLTENMAR